MDDVAPGRIINLCSIQVLLDIKVAFCITERPALGVEDLKYAPYSEFRGSIFLILAASRLAVHQRPHVSGTVVTLAWLLMAPICC